MVFTFNIHENNNIKANTVLIYLKFIFKRLENYYLPTDCVQIKMLGYMTESPNKCEGKYYHSEWFAVKISWIDRLKPFRFLYNVAYQVTHHILKVTNDALEYLFY